MIVCECRQQTRQMIGVELTVFPLPLWPTITVTGVKNSMTDMFLSSKDLIPLMASLFKLAIVAR